MVATETVNQARALDRLISAQATEITVSVPEEQHREVLFGGPGVQRALERLTSALSDRVDGAVLASFENQLYKVATALDMYRRLDLSMYSGVLVATQHSPIIRALFVAATEQRVPVVYVPHAPVAANSAYLDLPVDYAGLRGEGEREFYHRELGIELTDLGIVGNLASDLLTRPVPELNLNTAGVLALSPHQPHVLEQIFRIVAEADCGDMIVAPHPRSDLDAIRDLLPPSWSMFEGERTLDLLAAGPPFLFQFSSGVAWESAALGIPTATIHIDDSPVNYPFLADESIYPPIRTTDETQRFVSFARSGTYDRTQMRTHAEQWCAVDGDQAVAQLQELLETVSPHSSPNRLHDGWAKDGVALSRSWIASTAVAPESAHQSAQTFDSSSPSSENKGTLV
ncbi:hypothetical protein G7066_13415 [Leucobacter coleopterorum]|uniref:CDP-Glycerol:Poly(Glycerophosphate) glycerophosphotransferase n=1 Tax=Leucobacter coleopterorum TaxID=2714933 RepID=A0ABX6JZI3_9MICO|nr:hypothetical protein [Leucobacter coleopterorum]QIM19321.1 hypothetical protein G7066_13415 [Leucobacter coleopterorum]